MFAILIVLLVLADTRKKRYALWTWRLLLSQIDHRMFHEILRHASVHSLPTHIVLHTLRYHMNLHSLHLLLVFPSLTKPVVLYYLSHSPLKHSLFRHNALNHNPFSHKKRTTLSEPIIQMTSYSMKLISCFIFNIGITWLSDIVVFWVQ